MANVVFISPYNKITGEDAIIIEADNVRQLCNKIIEKYGSDMEFLLDETGELSRKIVLLVNRRNAYTLSGTDTPIFQDTEVMIMPYLGWG